MHLSKLIVILLASAAATLPTKQLTIANAASNQRTTSLNKRQLHVTISTEAVKPAEEGVASSDSAPIIPPEKHQHHVIGGPLLPTEDPEVLAVYLKKAFSQLIDRAEKKNDAGTPWYAEILSAYFPLAYREGRVGMIDASCISQSSGVCLARMGKLVEEDMAASGETLELS